MRFSVVTLEDRGVESTGMSPGLVGKLRAGTIAQGCSCRQMLEVLLLRPRARCLGNWKP